MAAISPSLLSSQYMIFSLDSKWPLQLIERLFRVMNQRSSLACFAANNQHICLMSSVTSRVN
jgi:hypothetical protein